MRKLVVMVVSQSLFESDCVHLIMCMESPLLQLFMVGARN